MRTFRRTATFVSNLRGILLVLLMNGTGELVLISMGHHEVFPHVGQNVKIQAPNGKMVHPLVTGTFGGADFIHSLMGEATDHLSTVSANFCSTLFPG